MAVFGTLQHAAQFAGQPLVQSPAEDLGDAVSAETQQPQIAGALEQFVDGEVAPEDQIAAVIELGANQLGAEGVGSRLECWGVRHPQKSVIVLRNWIPALRSCCSMK